MFRLMGRNSVDVWLKNLEEEMAELTKAEILGFC
jgi:hypothetical protein